MEPFGRNVMQDLANLTGKEVPGLRVSRFAAHYRDAVRERRAREEANAQEFVLNIPHLDYVKRLVAEQMEAEATEVNGHLPVASVFDALQTVKAQKNWDSDAGLRALYGHLDRMWKKDRSGSITASTYLKLHDHYRRTFPKSAAVGVIIEIGKRGYATLPVSQLHAIASQIKTQEDYDILIQRHGLNGVLPHQVKARRYILALVNEDHEEDEGDESFYGAEPGGDEPWVSQQQEKERHRRRREDPRRRERGGKVAAFMEPVVYEGDFVFVEDEHGEGEWIDAEYRGDAEGEITGEKHGWGAYMSAPGYMDRTDTDVCDTEEEAWDSLFDSGAMVDEMDELDEEYENYRDEYDAWLKRKGWDEPEKAEGEEGEAEEAPPSPERHGGSRRTRPFADSSRVAQEEDSGPEVWGGDGIGAKLLEYHGGQGTDLYAVGSSWNARRKVPRKYVEGAISELEQHKMWLETEGQAGRGTSDSGSVEEIDLLIEFMNAAMADDEDAAAAAWDMLDELEAGGREASRKTAKDYSWVTDEMFDEKLAEIINELGMASLFSHCYEELAEHFNNEVLDSLPKSKWDDNEAFENKLGDLTVNSMSAEELLQVPGVYEKMKELYNNEVLEALEEEQEGGGEPEEDDAHMESSGPLGSQTSAFFGGKHLGDFNSQEEAEAAIRAEGNKQQFFPNVWNVSDHGNMNLVEDFDWAR